VEQKIIFHPLTDYMTSLVPCPKPARSYIPDWFKAMPSVIGNVKTYSDGELKNKSAKLCMPFSDSFMMGYIQETWSDIHIGFDDIGNVSYNFAANPLIITHREPRIPVPEEYYPFEFLWKQPYGMQLPSGWSLLITHPLNRTDLPFQTMSGIVETDTYYRMPFPNNLPFLIKKSFNGVIPAGTPMFQMIPFQRQDWLSEVADFDEKANAVDIQKIQKFFQGGYKKIHWKRKLYS
jgi:hypothetical protein